MKKALIFIIGIACALFAVSCEDPALKEAYGESLVYMPQATQNADNSIKVTVSATSKSSITVGCYRSGLAEKEAFDVELRVASEALGSSAFKSATLLDSKYYDSLPAKLSVPAGERQASAQLVLHDSAIASAYPAGTVLCLPIKLANPSKYKLNESLATTYVVITVAR